MIGTRLSWLSTMAEVILGTLPIHSLAGDALNPGQCIDSFSGE